MTTAAHRAAMAAHLCDGAARALREGSNVAAWDVLSVAYDLRHGGGDPIALYRYGLTLLRAPVADIDAAVEAIAKGEHPAGSLPGRIDEMRGKLAQGFDGPNGDLNIGADGALHNMLVLLGVES